MVDIVVRRHKGMSVEIRSDSIWFTVYDRHNEPCGTLERPHRGQPVWAAYACNGTKLTPDWCAGPSHCLRSLAIWQGL